MAAYEDSFKSQLQGVSQQVPRERLDGQVSEQINMLSDPVTNLRRRPGTRYRYDIEVGGSDQPDAYVAWETVVGTTKCQVLLDCKLGIIRVLDMQNALVYTSPEMPYLQTTASTVSADMANSRHIQHAAVGNEVFLANTLKLPVLGGTNPVASQRRGFAWVVAGAFNTSYRVTVTIAGSTYAADYVTPDGSGPGDAALSTPAHIAQALTTLLNAVASPTVVTTVDGATMFMVSPLDGLIVASPAGLQLVVASNGGLLRREEDLPLSGPAEMDGYLTAVGSNTSKRYYRYALSSKEWLESGDAASPLSILNMPISLTNSGGVWSINSTAFEGRFAGDEESNPTPEFMSGITGLSAYQGRLVILAGSSVCMSASRIPRRFYRSTVTSILDSDPIGVSSTGVSAAAFQHAVQFNNDLLLFSDRNQALVPGSNVALTPRTAAVLPSTEYATDTNMRPLQVGRGLMFATPRSSQNFGIMEMLPSANTEYQYVSSDATQHLPTYMPGTCRFSVSSTVSNLAVFGSSTERSSVWVHEYTWTGPDKIQQAWHRWDFPFPVVTAYFSEGSVVLVLRMQTRLVGVAISPHGSRVEQDGIISPFLDGFSLASVIDGVLTPQSWVLAGTTVQDREEMYATVATTGERMPLKYVDGVFLTGASYQNGIAQLGFRYTSSVTPTPPMRKDYKGVRISTNKMTVQRYSVGTNNSGEFQVSVADSVAGSYGDSYTPLTYNSPELELGEPVLGADTTVVVPARTLADSTVLTMSSDGVSEFNLVGLEFVAHYHAKLKRAG